ncbi:Lipopolysaccharide biosynthesis protein WzxC [Rhodobacteraceae bacterium THAF1]|uniref:lipopolysaccharide biosynthesis protein n=1 Tax=Palleronia sp. THAF1 TaxID=2587842 RepID=UPI000F3DEA5B|nr:lipopolysaccharide biosynthesis protein [Palleronia sp. THAF1]QFU10359.1 Lipopolysaccharide biosynthesis protein WzxC [Palleronia sp. THAF1]VDC31478.1 Lipopolysaccharide biosynthesis protein WzxC [Rhodobacteraceae bacterium THAF1]
MISLIGFANTLLLARLLVPEDFGLVAIALSISAIVTSMTELSLAQALVQHKNPTDTHYNTAFTLNFLRAACVAVVLVIAGIPAAALYGDPRLFEIFIALGLSTLVIGAINPRLAKMSRDLVFWQDFATRSADKLAAFIVAVVVALIWQSYWALILGIIAGQATSLVLSYVIQPYRPRWDTSKWRDLMSFSIWVGLGQAVNTINYRFDQLALGYFLGNTLLGYYSVGDRLANLPTREATQPISQAVFPGFAKLADDKERLTRAYQRAQSLLTLLALPLGVGLAVAAEPLVLLALGEQWQQAALVIQFLASIFAIQTIARMVQPLAMGTGRSKVLFNRSLINLCIRVPLTLLGLLAGGFVGLLIGRSIAAIISIGVNLYLVRQILDLSVTEQIRINWRSLAGAAIMATVVYLVGVQMGDGDMGLQALKAAAMIAAGVVTYPTAVLLLWLAAGRPAGPERELMGPAKRLIHRVTGRERT